jgi:putative FmdB family regulatory protein
MPTYEYRCKGCGHELEAVQSFHDDPLTECPTCGGLLRKKFGSVGISFKGSGFYKTDSRTARPAKSTAESGSDNGSSGVGGSTDGGSTDGRSTDGGSTDGGSTDGGSGKGGSSSSKASEGSGSSTSTAGSTSATSKEKAAS